VTGRRTITAVIVLAVLSVVGLVAMLLVDGAADGVAFVVAALPLAAGAVAWWSQRRAPARRA